MMQAFTGFCWKLVEYSRYKVTAWSNAGMVHLPPVSKAQNGPFSMGMILLIILILETTIKMEL
jgi:hypothetical protein